MSGRPTALHEPWWPMVGPGAEAQGQASVRWLCCSWPGFSRGLDLGESQSLGCCSDTVSWTQTQMPMASRAACGPFKARLVER